MLQCLDCNHGNETDAKYCINCGQKTNIGALSFWSIIIDFLSNFFNLDGKIWKTCKDIWIPGKLTRAFIEGRRQRYYNPLRIFLVVLFAFFTILLFQIKDSFQKVNNFAMAQEKKVWKENLVSRFDSLALLRFTPSDSITDFRDKVFEKKIKIPDSLAGQNLDEVSKNELNNFIENDSLKTPIQISDILDTLIMQESINNINKTELSDNIKFNADSVEVQSDNELPNSIFKNFKSSDFYNLSNEALVNKYGQENWFNEMAVTQIQKILKDLSSSIKFVISNGTWAIFAVIFLLAVFFKLLYIRHNMLYVEHFIFHLYGHTRLLLLAILGMLVFVNYDNTWVYFWFLIGMIYLYIGMVIYYKQSKLKTLFKFIVVLFSYILLLCLCCFLILGISFMVL